jgi:hypothetical protein
VPRCAPQSHARFYGEVKVTCHKVGRFLDFRWKDGGNFGGVDWRGELQLRLQLSTATGIEEPTDDLPKRAIVRRLVSCINS